MIRPVRSVSAPVLVLLLASMCGPRLAAAGNQAPTIDPVPVQFGIQGADLQVQLAGHDLDGDQLMYSAEGLPAGLAIDRVSGLIIGEPATAGDSTILVSVSDGWQTASTAFALHVAGAPTQVEAIVTLNPQTSYEWDRIDLDVELLWDQSRYGGHGRIDRPPVGIFSVEGLPSGLRFSKKFGTIRGRIDTGTARPTPYFVTITMAEGDTLYTAVVEWAVLAR